MPLKQDGLRWLYSLCFYCVRIDLKPEGNNTLTPTARFTLDAFKNEETREIQHIFSKFLKRLFIFTPLNSLQS